ncbi:hypothetical protein GCM10023089_31990 [Quisquiliibacterium transsilvanicum]
MRGPEQLEGQAGAATAGEPVDHAVGLVATGVMADLGPPAGDDDGEAPDAFLAFVARVAAGRPTPADVHRLAAACAGWIEGDGESLEDLLGAPRTRAQRDRLFRDRALLAAVPLVQANGPWTTAVALHAAWRRFITRGDWRRWRDLPRPPAHADELGRCLFWASRHNGGDFLTVRQVYRVIRHRHFPARI